MATAKQVLHLIWMEIEDYIPERRQVEVKARIAEIVKLPVARPEVERVEFLPKTSQIKKSRIEILNGTQTLWPDEEWGAPGKQTPNNRKQ